MSDPEFPFGQYYIEDKFPYKGEIYSIVRSYSAAGKFMSVSIIKDHHEKTFEVDAHNVKLILRYLNGK